MQENVLVCVACLERCICIEDPLWFSPMAFKIVEFGFELNDIHIVFIGKARVTRECCMPIYDRCISVIIYKKDDLHVAHL